LLISHRFSFALSSPGYRRLLTLDHCALTGFSSLKNEIIFVSPFEIEYRLIIARKHGGPPMGLIAAFWK
jgi:hypothetical protein